MGCGTGDCGGNANKMAGGRVKPQNTKSANPTPNMGTRGNTGTTTRTTVIRNGKVISR